jgi:hypothetical protein
MSHPRTSLAAVLSLAIVLLGVVMILRTLAAGGGVLAVGLILGGLFVAAGIGRLYRLQGAR